VAEYYTGTRGVHREVTGLTRDGREKVYRQMAETYDKAALAIGWKGPSLIFGLMSKCIRPGQTILDIGIGTGLASEPFFRAGLRIYGMDISSSMLGVCQKKEIAARLIRHDLTKFPFPFGDSSVDHVISTGVFHFFPDLDGVFCEVARILPEGGRFAFVTGDRTPEEPAEIVAGPEQTGKNESVTMYCHTQAQVTGWLEKNGFRLEDSVPFAVWMDEGHTREMPLRAYLGEKRSTMHNT
jgi:predicted TPR repeat methyltransferase